MPYCIIVKFPLSQAIKRINYNASGELYGIMSFSEMQLILDVEKPKKTKKGRQC